MPREQINFPSPSGVLIYKGNEMDYERGGDVPDGGEVFSDPALHVNWQPAASDINSPHVQLSMQMPAGFLRARAEGLDSEVIDTFIYTPALSRQEINKLIRTLRRARDAAYGADE